MSRRPVVETAGQRLAAADEADAGTDLGAVNPLRQGLHQEIAVRPNIMVIFGATGDLAARKLIPGLYNLALQRLLPQGFTVVGASRTQQDTDSFRKEMLRAVSRHSRTLPVNHAVWQSFAQGLFYVPLQYDRPEDYRALDEVLQRLDRERGTDGNRLFYCATPPSVFTSIVDQLDQADMVATRDDRTWRRIVIEKPFGNDLASAVTLNRRVNRVFSEDCVFRIDHYLGKETVQNILVFRFANGIFEPIWNSQYVDHVQITVAEDIGIETRASYYEEAGALRDIVQNHLLQLLCLVAMEPPVAFDDRAVRDEKVKVLHALRPIEPSEVQKYTVRGQYGPGWVMGQPVPGYRQEPRVEPQSATDTYVALKVLVDNWRWGNTPFYLRTGKRLPKRVTEIAVEFKRPPHMTFSRRALEAMEANVLVLRIQPEEGISLRFGAKVPTPGVQVRTVNMDFAYGMSFAAPAADAHERLLLDAMQGDATLFARKDEVETAWAFIDPIEQGWAEREPEFPSYPAGTWGPEAADMLLAKDERIWRRP